MRAAVIDLLRNDAELNALGLDDDTIKPAASVDQRLSDSGPFIVIRWLTNDVEFQGAYVGPHHFDVYVHYPKDKSVSYDRIDSIIDRLDAIFEEANDTDIVGGDGRQLNLVEKEGRGPDLEDPTYQTILRVASYKALGGVKVA